MEHSEPTTGPDVFIQTATSTDLEGINAAVVNFHARAASVVDPLRFSELPPAYLHVSPPALREVVYAYPVEYDSALLAFDETVRIP